MGQAKKRGDFEVRTQQSIERKAAETEERIRREKEIWAAMTPEERSAVLAKQEKARNALRMFSASSALLSGDILYHPR